MQALLVLCVICVSRDPLLCGFVLLWGFESIAWHGGREPWLCSTMSFQALIIGCLFWLGQFADVVVVPVYQCARRGLTLRASYLGTVVEGD